MSCVKHSTEVLRPTLQGMVAMNDIKALVHGVSCQLERTVRARVERPDLDWRREA